MKLCTFKILTAIAVLTTTAAASPRYYVNTGISKAMAPAEFKDQWRSGFNIGVGVGFALAARLEVVGELSFHQMQLDDNAFLRTITSSGDVYASVSGGTASVLAPTVNFKYLVPTAKNKLVTPYLLGTVGFGNKIVSAKEITTVDKNYSEERESILRPSAGLSMGFEIVMAKTTSLVVEGGFQVLFTQAPSVYFPLKFGIVVY